MVRFPLKLWSSILFPGLLSSPCSISPGCSLTDMSEGKIWNKVPTRLVGESLERPSLLLSRRTFSPAAQDRRMLGMGLHRTSCHQFIPFHTKPWASGCPEMALTIEGTWCHHFIKPQPGPECLPLQKYTWTSIGRRRAHLPTPVWNVCSEKNNKCVCHEEEASAVPIRATLPFSKAPRAQHLGFSALPQKCIWREMTSGEQSLKASLLSFQEGEISYQLFSTSWWPVLPLGAATQRVRSLLCPL